MKQTALKSQMVAVQLNTHDGAFICNVKHSDVPKFETGEPGALIVMHCAIRLDAMIEGCYELHETKTIDMRSVDCWQLLERRAQRNIILKRRPTLRVVKGE
jgi:hypothetical protein